MLWTDGIFITKDDLLRVDSEVQNVAETTLIPLTGDYSVIRTGIEEAAIELVKMVTAFGGYYSSGAVSANHLAAVMNIGPGSNIKTKCTLGQVCVSASHHLQWGHVKQWAVFWTLMIIYRDAFNRTVQDRYEGKMRYYKSELTRRVTPSFNALGIPIVISPLPTPGALFERNAGSWDSDNVGVTTGPGAAGQYFVSITYVDMSDATKYVDPSNKRNAESYRAEPLSRSILLNQVITVNISSLTPPTGVQHPADALLCNVSGLRATHWNVYAGSDITKLYLQNPAPIPIDMQTYTFPGDPVLSGMPVADLGQYQDRQLALVPMRQRA